MVWASWASSYSPGGFLQRRDGPDTIDLIHDYGDSTGLLERRRYVRAGTVLGKWDVIGYDLNDNRTVETVAQRVTNQATYIPN